jgi:hypothetical protein
MTPRAGSRMSLRQRVSIETHIEDCWSATLPLRGSHARISKSAIALVLTVLLYHQTCLAQVDAWERTKLIEQGKNVNVKLHSGQMRKGRMES